MSVPFSTDFDIDILTPRTLDLMWERVTHPGRKPVINKLSIALEEHREAFLALGKQKFMEDMRVGVEQSLRQLPAILEKFAEELMDHLSTVKVLCLSSVNDDNGMWGLYAGDNQGLVLEFANQPGLDSVFRLAKPINYSDRPPSMLTDEAMSEFMAGDRKLDEKIADPLMYYKTTRWRDERELRLVSGEGRLPSKEVEDVRFHPRELIAVYFGARSATLREQLEPTVRRKYPHAKLWQAVKGKAMRIEFVSIEETVEQRDTRYGPLSDTLGTP
ncbi:DUF2971 domain-containing protein [Stenotrophomonas maltophilia]|uniref:DUF2971 domain-containing protein n=1 Tax=Stenotrophomonas maltophilia TaxID=40324 RepID=UPI00066D95BC|nr:DUF2971 domain-containing protein [Stenotrophomonas maltophilia]